MKGARRELTDKIKGLVKVRGPVTGGTHCAEGTGTPVSQAYRRRCRRRHARSWQMVADGSVWCAGFLQTVATTVLPRAVLPWGLLGPKWLSLQQPPARTIDMRRLSTGTSQLHHAGGQSDSIRLGMLVEKPVLIPIDESLSTARWDTLRWLNGWLETIRAGMVCLSIFRLLLSKCALDRLATERLEVQPASVEE